MKRVPSTINKAPKRLIVVLGMHRSGTSATTRALQVLGVDLGDNLMPGIVGNNEKGFWEDLDINKLNIELLQFISHDWHTLTPIPSEELKSENLADLRQKAIDLLRKKTKSVSIFGIKDPRMTRLLPFWQDVFDQCKFDVSYVIAIRNPLSVAESLYARDRFLKEKSCYMWLVNVLPSIIETEGKPRVVVDYDGIMDNPSFEIMRIAKTLGLEGRMNSDELNKFEYEFIEERLRHSRYQPEELNLDPFAPSIVIEMYGTLLQVAHDKLHFDSAEVQRCVARSTAHLKDIYPALRYMTCQDEQIASLGQAVSERDGQIASLNQAVAERDEHISDLQQKLKKAESLVDYFEHDKKVKEASIISLNNRCIETLRGKYEILSGMLNDKELVIETLQQDIEHLKNTNQSLENQERQMDAFINVLENSLSLKLGRSIGGIVKAPMHIFEKRKKG
jgi:hypothetical protein